MAMLVDGKWDEDADHQKIKDGQFLRAESNFRGWITADGSSGFKAEPGRYHLYLAHNCPWAYRARLFLKLKGLEDAISISIAASSRKDQGWMFFEEEGCIPDTVNGKECLHEIYTLADPTFTGRPTVPTLWDKEKKTIVNNESSEIIRMLNSEFSDVVANDDDWYPESMRPDIDAINEIVYENVNNGVYRCGFAKSQEAYEEWIEKLFSTLDDLEVRLESKRYLCGDRITEADWRLFATLIRFDLVYYVLFKCSRKHIYEYPNLSNYTRELYQYPGVAEVSDLNHFKIGYYHNMPAINPLKLVAVTPQGLDFNLPHDRGRLPKAG
jgi:putative glutathione S-transferase